MQEQFFDFWCKPASASNEDEMESGHRSQWEAFINALPADLSGKTVLDFGCNQGAFLRLLYSKKPFKQGTGVDLATKAIEIAESRKGQLPLNYHNTGRPDNLGQRFDLCISTSVLYFIDDFAGHARVIHDSLTENGEYYASFTDVNGSNMLPVWHNYLLTHGANVPFRIHSLDDIASGFLSRGFDVSIKRTIPADYIPLISNHTDSPPDDIKAMLELAYERSYVFRFVKKPA